MTSDRARLRRLRAARATGHVPPDLLRWLLDLADATGETPAPASRSTPAERLADAVGDEIDHWMARRGVKQHELKVSRSTVHRALAGANVLLGSIAEIADALGCEAVIRFEARAEDAACVTDETAQPAACTIGPEAER